MNQWKKEVIWLANFETTWNTMVTVWSETSFYLRKKTLPDNRLFAKTRIGNLLKQLAKHDALLKNYDTIFSEYLQEGIEEKASNIPNQRRI